MRLVLRLDGSDECVCEIDESCVTAESVLAAIAADPSVPVGKGADGSYGFSVFDGEDELTDDGVRALCDLGTLSVRPSQRAAARLQLEDMQYRPVSGDSLHRAAAAGDALACSLHVKAGVPVDSRDMIGWTPLLKAASRGSVETFETLAKAGASLEYKDANSWSCLMYAVRFNHRRIVRWLLDRGVAMDHSLEQIAKLQSLPEMVEVLKEERLKRTRTAEGLEDRLKRLRKT